MRREVQILDTLVAMQRHADYVRRGYRWWTAGAVELMRARRLVRRFKALYEVNLHRNTRRRRRKSGEGVALLLLYRLPGEPRYGQPDAAPLHIGWTLLVTDGECDVRHREKLRDSTQDATRLMIGPYELVRLSRPGQCTAAWSYRMSRPYYQAWRERVIRSARGDPEELPGRVLAELYREPGFAGVRSQVGHICALYRREWRRRRRVRDAFPRLPRLAYVQRLPTTSTSLSELLNTATRMAALAGGSQGGGAAIFRCDSESGASSGSATIPDSTGDGAGSHGMRTPVR